ncbi:cdkn1a interacting zinc finger protein 1b isoform X3 [Osmerus eperlanus]|uniref:cdkn1a interacting zinc finger protein 1b isoform X3 n=1 Tax=Osmerus eperlanus TaxID=29151 RepID=UPI002E128BCC
MFNHYQQQKHPRAQPQQRNHGGSRPYPVRISGPRGCVCRPVNSLPLPRAPPNLLTHPLHLHTHPLMQGVEVRYQGRGPPGVLLSYITTEEERDDVEASLTPGPGSEQPCRAVGGEQGNDAQVLTEEVGPGGGGCAGVEPTDALGDLSSQECSEQKPPAEGVGSSLKVTIQRSSESRAFSTGLEEASDTAPPSGQEGNSAAADRHYCHLCRTSCHSQQGFQSHMSSESHQQRGMEVQNQSSARLDGLLPHTHPPLQGSQADGVRGQGVQRWCATCQSPYRGDLILHRRTPEHKLCKQSSRPFCPACNRPFRTPRRFVEHMKSPEHKRQLEQLRQEAEPDVLEEELITLDAVGCFEGEQNYRRETRGEEEEKEKEKEEANREEESRKQGESRKEEEGTGESRIEIREQEIQEEEEENQEEEIQEEEEIQAEEEENQEEEEVDIQAEEEENQEEEEVEIQEDKMSVGGLKDSQEETINDSSFVVPVSGFLCRLCHKFFYLDSRARLSHCRSPAHLHNVQRYNSLRRSRSSAGEDVETHTNLPPDQVPRPGLICPQTRSNLPPDQLDWDHTAPTSPGTGSWVISVTMVPHQKGLQTVPAVRTPQRSSGL